VQIHNAASDRKGRISHIQYLCAHLHLGEKIARLCLLMSNDWRVACIVYYDNRPFRALLLLLLLLMLLRMLYTFSKYIASTEPRCAESAAAET